MKDLWNERYAQVDYVYGLEPNEYLKTVLGRIQQKGKVLFAAEGEGRNAVYAASLGFEVSAIDYSDAAKFKALQWAQESGVTIDYQVGDLNEIELEEGVYDVLVLVYAHFPPHLRKSMLTKLQKSLTKYGLVILEGFSQNHLDVSKDNERRSGPQDIEMLFTKKMMEEDFSTFETIEISEEVIRLSEGELHQGKSAVIRYMGRKVQ